MPIPKKVLNFLEKNNISPEIIEHKTVYTAYDLANTLKEKLEKISKLLVVKLDKGFAILVLPASHRVNLKKLKKVVGAKAVSIVKETDIKKVLKMKPGTQTPFARLHNLPVYIDKGFSKAGKIVTSAGSYAESLQVQVKDLIKTGGEVIDSFTDKSNIKLPVIKPKPKKKKKRVCKGKPHQKAPKKVIKKVKKTAKKIKK